MMGRRVRVDGGRALRLLARRPSTCSIFLTVGLYLISNDAGA
jgi:hypothetical protein